MHEKILTQRAMIKKQKAVQLRGHKQLQWNKLRMKKRRKTLLIFDMDGTLYRLKGGSYDRSPLKRRVNRNTLRFICREIGNNREDAKRTLRQIQKRYGEQISIGLEKEYGIDRYLFFHKVWDIPAQGIVVRPPRLAQMMRDLRRTHSLALVSDSPLVWIRRALAALDIPRIFGRNIFSGEGNRRKGSGNLLRYVVSKLKASSRDSIVIGDQECADILPAKDLGMKTILVQRENVPTRADARISSITNLPASLRDLQIRFKTNVSRQ
jgi:FMN phosphatase YigB (HAD superfamily)